MAARAGLYVHIPFCSAICPYCDFAVVRDSPSGRSQYLSLIEREVSLLAASWETEIETVYFGGGTPSALSPAQFATLATMLRERLPIAPDARWHLEANPEDIEEQRIAAWRAEDVTFLSLGMQSFSDSKLKFLGRRHRGEDAQKALACAQAGGFETVSVDLIFGLPQNRGEDLDLSLEVVDQHEVDHVSLYQLTFHEGTPFDQRRQSGGLVELDNDRQADLYLELLEQLGRCGLTPYEVSNLARSQQHQSRHNRKYWRRDPYLGVGLGAHSFDGQRRWWNVRDWKGYVARLEDGQLPQEEIETLTSEEARQETIMLALRTTAGLDLDQLKRDFGFDLAAQRPRAYEQWRQSGHLIQDGVILRPQLHGLLVADAIARDFF
ncbi:MAG: radical SAM family heme chaperone HemW [Planctomycetota bacterium]